MNIDMIIGIPLTKGKVALIDEEDYQWLNQWKWTFDGYYAYKKDENGKTIRMHNLIMNTPKGMDTDHINQNKLDNRKLNLRITTRSQNKMNVGLQSNNKSGIRGTYWNKERNKWTVQIGLNGKMLHVGHFSNLSDARVARINAENKYFGGYV